MTITEAKDLTFEFAQEMRLTKLQTITFSIAALNEKGFSFEESFIEVCGQKAWNMLGDYTPEQILEAVMSSF